MRILRAIHRKVGPVDTCFILGSQLDAYVAEVKLYGHRDMSHRLTTHDIVVTHIDQDSDFEQEILSQKGVKDT